MGKQHKWQRFLERVSILRRCQTLALPEKTLRFTFDDGPNPVDDVTLRLLEVLRAESVRAQFCPVGYRCEQAPELLKAIVDEGHTLVNHSYSHHFPLALDDEQLRSDIQRWDSAVSEILGREWVSHYYRPPTGLLNNRLRKLLDAMGKELAPITFYAFDTVTQPRSQGRLLKRMIRRIERDRGGILVLHDGLEGLVPDGKRHGDRSWVPDVTQQLIRHFRDQGYRFDLPEP